MYLNDLNEDKHRYLYEMVFYLFRRVQATINKRKEQLAEGLINDISLVKDKGLNSEIKLCEVFVRKLIKSGDKGIVLFLK